MTARTAARIAGAVALGVAALAGCGDDTGPFVERVADVRAAVADGDRAAAEQALDELTFVAERPPAERLEDQERCAVLGVVEVEHGHHTRIGDAGSGACLSFDASSIFVGEVLVEDLHRHRAVESRVVGRPDGRHAAAAEHGVETEPAGQQVGARVGGGGVHRICVPGGHFPQNRPQRDRPGRIVR